MKYTVSDLILKGKYIGIENREDISKENWMSYLIKYEWCFVFSQELKTSSRSPEKWVKPTTSKCLFLSINLTLGKEELVQSQVGLCSWLGDILKSV